MSTLMCQVTCTLCNIKIDELKWKEHQTSENHLKKCGENHNELTTKFFKMIFDIKPQREEIFNLKNEKTHDFWQAYFSAKLPKEKFDGLCNSSIDKVEIEDSLSKDFNEFIPGITPFIGRNYYDSMKITTFCKLCSIEIDKSLLFDHIISKEHRVIEDYFIMKCMTYCECCDKEIKNDEWREHICSEKHLIGNNSFNKYCEVCRMCYSTHMDTYNEPPHKTHKHLETDFHKRNLFRSRYIFK